MIGGLHHVAVAVRDFDAGMDGYRRLLGREPEIRDGEGARRAWFGLPNMALEVIAPVAPGAAADRVNAHLDEKGEGVWLAAFHVEDMPAALRLIERRGLTPRSTRPSAALIDVAGIVMALTSEERWPVASATGEHAAAIAALDHVVVSTPNPDRALANYGAKFGLDLRLDRENAQWGARQLFFRCGDAVFEVGASLKAPASDGPDRFGGLAWRTTDPDATHARLAAAGFNVSELRTGRKPGTKVFTVRDAPGGVPTLIIQQNAEAAEIDARVLDVEVTDARLEVRLRDGRTVSAPIEWFPRLAQASKQARARWETSAAGLGIHWPDIDEDLSVEGLLRSGRQN